jgi:acyl-ACP thioesterase
MAFIQTDEYTLRGYECDATGRMSMVALMNLMQESANRNAIAYGIGIADLAEQGFGWMLMRFRVRMHHYPRYGQTIRVITYPTFVEKYFIYRDFRVLAEDGSLLADAASTWLVFSIARRVMVPLPAFIRAMMVPPEVEMLSRLPLKPDFQLNEWEAVSERIVEVGWTSIDQNQHVNNVSYVQWLLEAVDRKTLLSRELAEIDVVYRAETHWKDQLRIQWALETTDCIVHRIELDNQHPGEAPKEVLLARSRWRVS